jgi:hypothetical protein
MEQYVIPSANPWMWLVVLCLTTSCQTSGPSEQPPSSVAKATNKVPASSVMAKIAPPIRHVVQRMQDDGVTGQNVAARTTTSYSNPLVRVDARGRIHTAIRVTHVDPQVVSDLQAAQVELDQTAGQDTMQGWIPFDRVEQVAALAFVRDLRPPRYAIHR